MSNKLLFLLSILFIGRPSYSSFIAGEEAFQNRRYSEAFNEFLPDATKGDFRSQYYVGYLYLNGLGIEKDVKKALQYIQSSADQGYDTAQALLGYLYEEGKVLPKNGKKAIKLYQEAAQSGNTSALLNLGLAYYNGLYVGQDFSKAISYLKRVPLEEQPMVGRYLGDVYLKSSDQDKYSKAVEAYTSSAKFGDIASFYELSKIFSSPNNPNSNPQRAINFLKYAASAGNESAQYQLGVRYANGDLVEKNKLLAHAWLEIASKNNESASIALQQISKSFTLSEIEKSREEFINLQQNFLGKLESPFIEEERLSRESEKKEDTSRSRSRSRRRRR